MQSESRVSLQTAPQAASPSTALIGWIPLLVLPLLVVFFGLGLLPWAFMWLLAIAIFVGLKWITWWNVRAIVAHRTWRSIAYLFAWPGMDAETFLNSSQRAARPKIREWLWASAKTVAGVLLIWVVARRVAAPLAQGWISLFGLVLLLHFGSFHIIALFWQACGVAAQPIMAKPILSKTLLHEGKRIKNGNLGTQLHQPSHPQLG